MNEYSFNEFNSFKAIRDLQVFQEICLTNFVPFEYSFNDFHQTNEFVWRIDLFNEFPLILAVFWQSFKGIHSIGWADKGSGNDLTCSLCFPAVSLA